MLEPDRENVLLDLRKVEDLAAPVRQNREVHMDPNGDDLADATEIGDVLRNVNGTGQEYELGKIETTMSSQNGHVASVAVRHDFEFRKARTRTSPSKKLDCRGGACRVAVVRAPEEPVRCRVHVRSN